MDLAVLGFRELAFDLVVNAGSDIVGLTQEDIAVAGDFNIHKIAGAEAAGFDVVQTQHAWLRQDQRPNLLYRPSVYRAVQHFVERIG